MKPHEETWTAELYEGYEGDEYQPARIVRADGSDVLENFSQVDGAWMRPADLTLASQAPAMARLLLSIQWSGEEGCPDCGHSGQHHDKCDLVKVLRAAGVSF